MAILTYAEHHDGKLHKSSFESATYAAKAGEVLGDNEVHAVLIGELGEDEIKRLGKYGVSKVYQVPNPFEGFNSMGFAEALYQVAQSIGATKIVMSQSYNCRAIAPRLAVKCDASLLSGAHELPKQGEQGIQVRRIVFSNKGIQTLAAQKDRILITVKGNSIPPEENAVDCTVEAFDFQASEELKKEKVVEQNRNTEDIPLTDAEVVVSGGRGLKGPENWNVVENLAQELGAATACSKPVADAEWRPHHEHVGQTGIQIAPNVYIAIGISGAIQHLAGVSASKTIIAINKDPEAPFFKAADYGIVGDAFEIVPKLTEAVKKRKAEAS
jgi:electron transfer flavoprotein alpha subunit